MAVTRRFIHQLFTENWVDSMTAATTARGACA